MNSIGNLGFQSRQATPLSIASLQKAKSLSFGDGWDDHGKNEAVKQEKASQPTFEQQVIANQIKMIGLLEKIDKNLPSNTTESQWRRDLGF